MCHVARDAGGARVQAQCKPRVVTNAKRGPQLTPNGAYFKSLIHFIISYPFFSASLLISVPFFFID